MNSNILKQSKIIYALVDCNNFYASCERVFAPKLKNCPVIILSNNDGCAVAMSNEAKALGIKLGTPYYQVRELAEKNNAAVFSSNYELYGDMSNRVMNTLIEFSPLIEFYSIDEAFLRLEGFTCNLEEYAEVIRKTVFRKTGIPVSVGVAPTKTLAKIANRYAKKNGCGSLNLVGMDETYIDNILEKTFIEDVWGIGRRKGMKLVHYGIKNALQLKNIDDSWGKKQLGGLPGLRVIWELRGMDAVDLEEVPPDKQQILSSRSFGNYITEFKDMEEAIASYAIRSAEKLRKQNGYAQMVHIYIATNRFNENHPQYRMWYNVALKEPTNYTPDIINAALKGLRDIFKENYFYKKAGVMLSEIITKEESETRLFVGEDLEKKSDLMGVIDNLNKKFGKNTMSYGISGENKNWNMKREFLSPRSTTRWDEIPNIKI